MLSPQVEGVQDEPPLRLLVRGLGEERVVYAGSEFKVEWGGESRTLSVELHPHRRLCTPEVCLDYPSHFGFDYDPSEGSETWTLDGNDATLQVQINPFLTSPKAYAGEMFGYLADLGDGEILKAEPNSFEVEGLRLKAFRATIPWDHLEFRCDVYAVLDGRKAATFLILQEVASQGAPETLEVTQARQLLVQSLRSAKSD